MHLLLGLVFNSEILQYGRGYIGVLNEGGDSLRFQVGMTNDHGNMDQLLIGPGPDFSHEAMTVFFMAKRFAVIGQPDNQRVVIQPEFLQLV